jgi:scavenger receptor class B protein 1
VELYFDVYLFNWTNYDKFAYPDFEKPRFRQHGPYRFREVRDKVDIEFNGDNATVSYRVLNNYYFDGEGSEGSLDDVITNINMVAIGAAAQSMTFDYHMRKVMSQVLNGYYEDIFVTKTARELLFEGYDDDMVTMGKMGSVAGFDMSSIPYDKIGWFYLVSGSWNNFKNYLTVEI